MGIESRRNELIQWPLSIFMHGDRQRCESVSRYLVVAIHEGDKPQSTIDAPTGAQIPGSSALPHVMWLTRLRRRDDRASLYVLAVADSLASGAVAGFCQAPITGA